MKKKLATGLATGLLMFGMAGMAQAALTTIGTAQFGGAGTEYNLIWDNDNNGNSIIWLDYTPARANWSSQKAWAAGLGSTLTYNIDAAHTVAWGGSSWRLPSAGVNPTFGYNITTSEMGHLYYSEMGLTGGILTTETLNGGIFDNLVSWLYWCDTEYAPDPAYAWVFYIGNGNQGVQAKAYNTNYGLAVRNGQVSAVPIPGAVWLLGSGLTGLAALRRRKNGNRV